jgi:hypothetical protein
MTQYESVLKINPYDKTKSFETEIPLWEDFVDDGLSEPKKV